MGKNQPWNRSGCSLGGGSNNATSALVHCFRSCFGQGFPGVKGTTWDQCVAVQTALDVMDGRQEAADDAGSDVWAKCSLSGTTKAIA